MKKDHLVIVGGVDAAFRQGKVLVEQAFEAKIAFFNHRKKVKKTQNYRK